MHLNATTNADIVSVSHVFFLHRLQLYTNQAIQFRIIYMITFRIHPPVQYRSTDLTSGSWLQLCLFVWKIRKIISTDNTINSKPLTTIQVPRPPTPLSIIKKKRIGGFFVSVLSAQRTLPNRETDCVCNDVPVWWTVLLRCIWGGKGCVGRCDSQSLSQNVTVASSWQKSSQQGLYVGANASVDGWVDVRSNVI